MAIIITKSKGTVTKNDPIILQTEDIVELSKDNINLYSATIPESKDIDITDIIKNPDVEFRTGSLTSVLNTIGDSQYDSAIIVSNGQYNNEGTTPILEDGQSYEPNVIVARGNLVTSPILGIDVNTDMDTVNKEDSPFGKELFLGISKIKGKTIDFEKYKLTHKKEIYEIQQKLAQLDSIINISTITLTIDNSTENNISIYEDTESELTAERFFEILTKYKNEQVKLNILFNNETSDPYHYYVTVYNNKCILSIIYGKEFIYDIVVNKSSDNNYTVTASIDKTVVVKSEPVATSF